MKCDIFNFLLSFSGNGSLTTGSGLGSARGEINSSSNSFTLSLAFWIGISTGSLGIPLITSFDGSSSRMVTHFLLLVISYTIVDISSPTILQHHMVIGRHGILSFLL